VGEVGQLEMKKSQEVIKKDAKIMETAAKLQDV
jgi:hypothetical protein